MAKKLDTKEKLIAAGYVPRDTAVQVLRGWADGLEKGSGAMLVRSPEQRPGLWVKLDLRLNYADLLEEKA